MKPTNSFISQSVKNKDKSPLSKNKYNAKLIKEDQTTHLKNKSPKKIINKN